MRWSASKDRRPVLPFLTLAVVVFTPLGLAAGSSRPGEPLDRARRAAVIDSVSSVLNGVYVFPDVAARIEEHLRERLASGAYDALDNVPAFADALHQDLREVSHDLHLAVAYSPPEERPARTPDPEDRRRTEREALAQANFGFVGVERLPGNVGYLRLDRFANASLSGRTAIAALNFLAECDALIIDLRWNTGGDPSLIQLMASYFLAEPTHLSSFYIRKIDKTMQFWTQAHVSGPRMTGVDLYVLVGSRTFSAAEGFCYSLQARRRATIIGETTQGGAHPVERHRFPDLNIVMNVPFGRPIDPITGANWEGTGVVPEIAAPAEEALRRAHLEALRRLREAETDDDRRAELTWFIAGIEAEPRAFVSDPELLASYAGTYGPRSLSFDAGALYYQRGGNPRMRAIPIAERLFRFDENDRFRLEVVLDAEGEPIKLVGHYMDGHQDESQRSERVRSRVSEDQEGESTMAKNLACWWEINAEDGKSLADFYSEVFAWEPSYDERTGIWHIDSGNGSDGGIGGGIFTGKARLATHRCLYVKVDDVDAIAERAKRLGRPTLQGPFDLENGTRLAFFRDPEGHMIGLIKPARKQGE